jgi:hypothetical protein
MPVIGESWGSIWYYINFPLSIWFEKTLWPYGLFLYVAVVTVINTGVVYYVVTILSRLTRIRK